MVWVWSEESYTAQAAIEGLMITAGTGTDSIAIFYPQARPPSGPIEFAGMHTITGELIARTAMNALKKSIGKYI